MKSHKVNIKAFKGESRLVDIEFIRREGDDDAIIEDMGYNGLFLMRLNRYVIMPRGEYEAHIEEKRCPAKVCKDLISYYIQPDKCQACMICLRSCPVEAIDGGKGLIHWINQEKCTKCGTCLDLCPPRFNAVTKLSGEPIPPPPLNREVARAKRSEE